MAKEFSFLRVQMLQGDIIIINVLFFFSLTLCSSCSRRKCPWVNAVSVRSAELSSPKQLGILLGKKKNRYNISGLKGVCVYLFHMKYSNIRRTSCGQSGEHQADNPAEGNLADIRRTSV